MFGPVVMLRDYYIVFCSPTQQPNFGPAWARRATLTSQPGSVLSNLLQIFFGSFSTAAAQLGMPSPQTGDQLFRAIGPKRLSLVFATALISIPAWAIQDAVAASPSRLTATIPTRQKIFISNTSDGQGVVHENAPAWTYDRFYAVMQTSGRYDLVTRPPDADLIFEIAYREPWEFIPPKTLYPFGRKRDTACDPYHDYRDYLPQVRLAVWNARHRALLGTFTQPFNPDFPLLTNTLQWHVREEIDTAVAGVVDRAEQTLNHSSIVVNLPKDVSEAPVPPVIAVAAKVFIVPADDSVVGARQLYNAVLSAMKSWGRFELVSQPQDADLLLDLYARKTVVTTVEIRQKEPYERDVDPECPYKASVIESVQTEISLKIMVPNTQIVLWGFLQPMDERILTYTRTKTLGRVTKDLMDRLRHVVQRSEAGSVHTANSKSSSVED
jgi:hypothetical protein